MLYLLRLGTLNSMAGSVLLVAATQEFKLGGENNAMSMASFVPFFAISLRAIINVPSNYIVRFLCLYNNI